MLSSRPGGVGNRTQSSSVIFVYPSFFSLGYCIVCPSLFITTLSIFDWLFVLVFCVVFLCFARLCPVSYVPNVSFSGLSILDCPSVFSNVFTVFRLLTDFVCLYTYAF